MFGDTYYWSVLGAGRNQMFIAAMSAVMGGKLEELGLAVATPDEARGMLKLKGGRNVGF